MREWHEQMVRDFAEGVPAQILEGTDCQTRKALRIQHKRLVVESSSEESRQRFIGEAATWYAHVYQGSEVVLVAKSRELAQVALFSAIERTCCAYGIQASVDRQRCEVNWANGSKTVLVVEDDPEDYKKIRNKHLRAALVYDVPSMSSHFVAQLINRNLINCLDSYGGTLYLLGALDSNLVRFDSDSKESCDYFGRACTDADTPYKGVRLK